MIKGSYLNIEERNAYRSLEDVVGCKWSTAVLGAIQRGVNRPGKLERFIPGISTKVLNERLRKLLNYGLITKEDHSDQVLHVEYQLTPVGIRLANIIEQLHALSGEHEGPAS